MAYVLPSERVEVTVDDCTIEVCRIGAYPLWVNAVRLASAWSEAKGQAAEIAALGALYAFFVGEAQPTWAIVDHRGTVPATPAGMWRLPLTLGIGLVSGWMDPIEEKATAVDAMVPPGDLRDELNARLRAKRRKAA